MDTRLPTGVVLLHCGQTWEMESNSSVKLYILFIFHARCSSWHATHITSLCSQPQVLQLLTEFFNKNA